MEHLSYKNKASQMYERAMEDVHSRVDTAKHSLEEIQSLLDDLEPSIADEQYEELESLISKAIIALCGV